MTTIEKPTVPSPRDLLNTKPALNERDYIYIPERNVDALGRIANRDEYRVAERSDVVTSLNLDKTEDDFATARATNDIEATDDKSVSDLDAFTIHDDTEVNNDVDELPEDLKSELGEPDNDEVKA